MAIGWEYRPRLVDVETEQRLSALGAVVIEGPKACGKTETARHHAHSEVLLDIDAQARAAAEIDPSLILSGEPPRLIDEWQTVPAIWNHVRREVDARRVPGQFILTGSATPADDHARHTGAGRFGRVRMRPMSTLETGRGTGEISLSAVLEGTAAISGDSGWTIPELAEEIVRGGWPGFRDLPLADAAAAIRDYLDQIRRTDITAVDGVTRDPVRVGAMMRSLARNISTQAALTKVAREAAAEGATLADETAAGYLMALERLMVIENQPAWNTHLRSSHQLRTAATRHFCDPSLAVAALRAGPAQLLQDFNFLGLLFESMVVRDLRVYAQPLGGNVFHYRDNSGLEVDAIVDAGSRWGAFEVKLGSGQIDTAAANLLRFANRVDTSRRGTPACLGVIVATGYGYRRNDGVDVIPVAALGP